MNRPDRSLPRSQEPPLRRRRTTGRTDGRRLSRSKPGGRGKSEWVSDRRPVRAPGQAATAPPKRSCARPTARATVRGRATAFCHPVSFPFDSADGAWVIENGYEYVYIWRSMKYTWDERKRRINLKKHGLDFADAPLIFAGLTLTVEDPSPDYNEERFRTLGMLGPIMVVLVVHTETEDEIRVISMRKADSRERRAYEEAVCI